MGTAYGKPPTDVEAVAQNQGAVVWWKIPIPFSPEKQQSQQPGDKGSKTKQTKVTTGGITGREGGGGGGAGGRAGEGGNGSVAWGVGGGILEESQAPETVGFVVYRYRLDGREWHKKGATNVEGAKAVSGTIKALSNGLVYR